MSKNFTSEFILILYTFGFTTIRPVIYFFNSQSTFVVGGFIFVSLFFWLKNRIKLAKKELIAWTIFSFFFEFLIYISRSELSSTYMVNFFMYGIISVAMLMKVFDYKEVLHWVYVFSFVNAIVIGLDPFFEYKFTGGYMEYGFNMVMFSFSGFLIGKYYFHKKYVTIPIIFELVMISFYGNKGAIITAFCLIICLRFLFSYSAKRLLYSLITGISLCNWKLILSWIISGAKSFGVSSYSISTMEIMLSDKSDYVYSARTNIWKLASEMISKKPIFGYGVGKFEMIANGSAHNVFYDITLAFGFFGLILFLLLLINSIYHIYIDVYIERKVICILCLITWIVPMQFSLTLWNVIIFWVYWGLYLYNVICSRCVNESFNTNI